MKQVKEDDLLVKNLQEKTFNMVDESFDRSDNLPEIGSAAKSALEFAQSQNQPFDPSQWEEHIKNEQSYDHLYDEGFASTFNHKNHEFTEADFNPDLDSFKQQWEDFQENNFSQDQEQVYKFTRENPYLDAPQGFLENESMHQNLTETLFCIEALILRDPQNAQQWTNLGEYCTHHIFMNNLKV